MSSGVGMRDTDARGAMRATKRRRPRSESRPGAHADVQPVCFNGNDADERLISAAPLSSSFFDAIMNDAQDRPPLSIFRYLVLPQLVVCVVVALRPSLAVRLATWAGVAATLLYAVRFDTREDMQNYSMGCTIGSLVFNALVMLAPDVLAQCRHEDQTKLLTEMSLWERMYNVQCIAANTRGIGWNYQVPHLPPRSEQSRERFIWGRLLRIARFLLILDMVQTYIDLNPAFGPDKARLMWTQNVLVRFFNVLTYATKSYCLVTVPYDIASVLAVGTRLSEPKAWPMVVGRWRDAYTVRRFWGRVWHQSMRRFVSAIGKYSARTLGCAPGSWLSSHVQLLVGFVVSGVAHLPGDAMVHPRWAGASFWFFPAQAAAITFEDAVIAQGAARGLRDTRWTRIIGYVWTAAWLVYTASWFTSFAARAGLAREHLPYHLPVMRPLLDDLAGATGFNVTEWIVSQCAIPGY